MMLNSIFFRNLKPVVFFLIDILKCGVNFTAILTVTWWYGALMSLNTLQDHKAAWLKQVKLIWI